MADKIEIVEAPPPPPQPTLSETQLQMAVAFGQMTKTNETLISEIQAEKAERSQTTMLLTEALAEIRNLRLQTDTTSHRVEQLNESQRDIMLATTAPDSESDDKVIEITPPMETHIEIDQKPAKRPNLLQRLFF